MILLLLIIPLSIIIIFGYCYFYFCEAGSPSWLAETPIAHRGLYTKKYGDNSLKSFMCAIDNGYAIELDLRGTKDHVPFVIHDNDLYASTGIREKLTATFCDEAKKLIIHATGEGIPTFSDVLNLVNGKVPILIEIKSYFLPGIFEKKIIDLLDNYVGEFAIQSYNPLVCNYIKRKRQKFTVGLLLNDTLPDTAVFWRRLKDNLFTLLCFPNFIAYNYMLIDNKLTKRCRSRGLLLLGFVFDKSTICKENYLLLVDNIIFDGD